MDTKQTGLAGLRGCRGSVADAVARPVAKRSSVGEDQIRAMLGALFLALSVYSVVSPIRDLARDR